MTRELSRRSFLGGALSLGAFAGCRAFHAPAGAFAGDGARLTVCDAMYNMARRRAGQPTRFTLKGADLARGAVPEFSVTALDSFGNRSAALKS